MVVQKGKRSARVERILKKKEPQLVENTKRALIMRGNRTSEDGGRALKDFARLLKPNVKTFSRKNDIHPFEDSNSLEFLCDKNDCSLFIIGSHSKKRPHNLTLGRMYDGHLLDMVELGMSNFHDLESFVGKSKAIGSKPVMIFLGEGWESDVSLGRVQNLFIDMFRGDKMDKLCLKGLDHVMTFAVVNGTIMMRLFSMRFKKSGSKVPIPCLEPMGPYMNLTLRRVHLASEDAWKTACKGPKGVSASKKKNIKHTEIGEKLGRVHLKKQQLDDMGGRRVTALRSSK